MLPRERFRWTTKLKDFAGNESGQIAILFGLAVTMIVMAAGGGIDLARAYQARQRLSEVATLSCQYAARASIIQTIAPSYSGSNGSALYATNVQNYITAALVSQQFPWTQTTGTPFSFTIGGPANVTLTANVPTSFMKIAHVAQMPVAATSHCYDNSSNIVQQIPNGNNSNIVQEGFENSPCSGMCYVFINANGSTTPPSTPSSTFPANPGYTGTNGNTWYITGYCIEIDSVGVIRGTVAEGTHSAELDCDNGSGSAGNSAISTKVYMQAGDYELRYNFASRVAYPDYDPTYICGTTATDNAWATSTRSSGSPVTNALRTNQINVYLDLNVSGSPGFHTTLDGTQQLAGVNLIDMCVHSSSWIERSVRIMITTPGFYWLSFAADGQNDSYGGQLDNIRLCPQTCPTVLADNFPSTWLAANNGGSNKILFEDSFESPTYSANYSNWINYNSGNLNLSNGTTVTTGCYINGSYSSYPSLPGWPCQAVTGWATAPFNQIDYILQGASPGSQYISMDSYNPSGSGGAQNRLISRPFVLDPGYYRLDYQYMSDVDLSAGGYVGSFCYNMPGSQFIVSPTTSYPNSNGYIRFFQSTSANLLTNLVGVFMANGQLISTPIGGGAFNSTTSYLNTNGTTSTTPNLAPDNVNYGNYNAGAVNPLLDFCNYTSNFNWLSRTAYVQIVKPGKYWLTFSANGGADDASGGGIDDVKLTALGSLYMSSPPSAFVSIPAPSAAPGAQIPYSGYYIIADPLMPPAPLQ